MASPPKNALSPAARQRLAIALAGAGGPTAPSPDQMMPAPHAVAPPGFGGSLRVDPTEQPPSMLAASPPGFSAVAPPAPGFRQSALANALATPGFRAQTAAPSVSTLRLGPGRYAETDFPTGSDPTDLSMYSHLPAGKDTEARENHVAKAVFDALTQAMGYKGQGGSKWSNYARGPNGEDFRVSNHPAFNPGSMGVDPEKRVGVQISEGAGELTLTSPTIRKLYGGDVTFPLTSEAFEALPSPDSIARLKSLLESGSH